MANPITIETIFKTPAGDVRASKEYTAGTSALAGINEAIASDAADVLYVWTCDVSQVKTIVLLATQDMTLKTNSSTVPADTLVLKANSPYVWSTDSLNTLLLTVDVTALYVTNNSTPATAGTLTISGSYDPTP